MYKNNQNSRLPSIGYGTYPLTGEKCKEAVLDALQIGYRHIDTASSYENEADVGRAIQESSIDRRELFVTTKIWYTDLSPEKMKVSAQESLKKLKMDYVDLLLIHWPSPEMNLERSIETLMELKESGKAKGIGVSNFPPKLFKRACALGEIFTNQVEYHPFLNNDTLLNICEEYGVLLTAYSPLAHGKVMREDVLINIGKKYGKTAAQVTLKWLIQQPKVLAIPQASSHEHRVKNLDIMDFELTNEEMVQINGIKKGEKLVNPSWSPDWEL